MKIIDWILDLLFPRRCAFCHRLTQENAAVCPRCLSRLPVTGPAARQDFPHLEVCFSPLYYVEPVRASLLRYKFGGLTMYAEIYGEFLSKCIDENGISCDSITWVPLSRRRLRKRGYDQARLLAEALSGRTGLPCEAMLVKVRNNRVQSTVGKAAQRKENVRDAYSALSGAGIEGKRVLLVDDIVTTGSTLSECAKVLEKAGAKAVVGLTVARRRD